jgi:hypothetical protein
MMIFLVDLMVSIKPLKCEGEMKSLKVAALESMGKASFMDCGITAN